MRKLASPVWRLTTRWRIRAQRVAAFSLLATGWLCAPATPAQTVPLVQVPVDCQKTTSCGEDPSLRSVKRRYKSLGGAALVANTALNRCDPLEPDAVHWGPADAVEGGPAAIAALIDHAQRGTPDDRTVIVETAASSKNERHLARCSVTTVGDTLGPPRDCVTMAILTPERNWLRGEVPQPPPERGEYVLDMCPTAAHIRLGGAIDINYDVRAPASIAVLAQAIQHALETRLDLKVELDDAHGAHYVSLDAASGMHNSKVLTTGWREIMDVSVYVESNESEHIVSISGLAHLLVVRQAVADISRYQGLNDAQRTLYARELDDVFADAIASVCQRFRRIDDKTVSCN